jgi:hypothetical protein
MGNKLDKKSLSSDIEIVRLENRDIGKTAKFIVATVKDKTERVVLRSNTLAKYHKDIYQEILFDTDYKLNVTVNGGGKLYFNDYDKTIWVWGVSTDFGAPDYKKVVDLLQQRYPDFKITLLHSLPNGEVRTNIVEYISRGDIYKFMEPLKILGKNEKIVDGKTALHLAVEFDQIEIVEKILDLAVKVIKDDKNRTAFELAEFLAKKDSLRYEKIVNLLKQYVKR